MSPTHNRRGLLQLTAAAAAMLGLGGYPGVAIAQNPEVRKPKPIEAGKKIRIAAMGFNNKGFGDVRSFPDEEIVALCDVDWGLEKVQQTFKEFPKARRYKDFRKMLLELDGEIDALVVSTADHMHFLPAAMAIVMGKHVFVQKPLTRTVWEARELRRLAALHGVCTQMGNQGHQGEGCRLVKEWIEAGVIGEVRKVYIWTNRPIWPQGIEKRPDPMPAPEGLDWELFLGRAPERPYNEAYHPFAWRGWADYGCGALGDMGCHTMDASFYALDLGAPTSIQAECSAPIGETFPKWSVITYEFPARGKFPPATVVWSDGGKAAPRPAELEEGRQMGKSGQYYQGEKGVIYDGQDYCNSPRIIPEPKMKELQPTLPKKTIRRPDPVGNPYQAWTQAIRKNEPEWANSHFDYSARLTEMVVLGNLALRAPGKKLLWDAEKMEVTNAPELSQYLKPTFRPNWAQEELKEAKRQGTEDLTMPKTARERKSSGKKKDAKAKGEKTRTPKAKAEKAQTEKQKAPRAKRKKKQA
ncbi:MAG: Gfo/Idh/MocA family oxidoreductase [Candidatus Sumerlaeota bacterium]|nr:Gfo/Idh/MocA family oxidoreductase [Candidatus Sumerlaeota bacterium]